jgi:hypothetical protein
VRYRTNTMTTHTEWRYHMLHVYNVTSWGWAQYCSKHVEGRNIIWIKRSLCIKLVNDTKSILWCTVRKTSSYWMLFHSWSMYSRTVYIQPSVSDTAWKSRKKMQYLKDDKTALTPFCFPGSKILLIKNTRIWWAANVAYMWENRTATRGFGGGNRRGIASLENLNVDWDNKMDHKQLDGSGLGWIAPPRDTDKWRALVNTVTILQVSSNAADLRASQGRLCSIQSAEY